MVGFLPIALRVPMERLPTGYKNYGGELEIDLGSEVPTGDGFYLLFMNTYHGEVYAKVRPFFDFSRTANLFCFQVKEVFNLRVYTIQLHLGRSSHCHHYCYPFRSA